jgi:hypothetical protein
MRGNGGFVATWTTFVVAVIVLILCIAVPVHLRAQGSPGNNAVYNSSAVCCVGSSSFIDASVLQAQDFCDTIYQIIHSSTYTPAVIDARGISSHLTCTLGSPWSESSGYANKPSTILLPATSATNPITISIGWVLPNGTKLIGEGTTNPTFNTSNAQAQTTIQASSTFPSGSSMIQFGDSHCPSQICAGISVESLTLYGNSQTITGIQNQFSQNQTSVNHVTLYHVLGTGLQISSNAPGSAQNSGPYSNINYDTGTAGVFGSTCAQIDGLSGTSGIHGLSCVSSPESQNAVLLDSSNNTLEDVRIMGFVNGIYVGSLAPAHGNVLLNILGDTTGSLAAPPNVVHIANVGNAVTDLAIVGVANQITGTNIIRDDVTGTTLVSGTQANSYVSMYVLGEPKTNAGYSRFTTSPSAPNWSVGGDPPSPVPQVRVRSLDANLGFTIL